MVVDETVYGVWDDDTLVAVGTEEQLKSKKYDTYSDFKKRRYVRTLTTVDGTRAPNKWRDLAAAALRDLHGMDYEDIAHLLHITTYMAQAAVSRVRCGRYGA